MALESHNELGGALRVPAGVFDLIESEARAAYAVEAETDLQHPDADS